MTALGSSGGASYPTCKFEKFGDSVTGTIIKASDMQAREFGTGTLQTYPDGNPVITTVLTIVTEPGGDWMNLFVKAGRMRQAVIAALNEAAAQDVEPGGKIRLTYTSEQPGKRGGMAKVFSARYKKPTPGWIAPKPPVTAQQDPFEDDDIPASAFVQDAEPPF